MHLFAARCGLNSSHAMQYVIAASVGGLVAITRQRVQEHSNAFDLTAMEYAILDQR